METHIVRPQQEIDEVLNWALETDDVGTRYPGMYYEDGIRAMYDWLVGNTSARPDEG